jgi:hypothetical protein
MAVSGFGRESLKREIGFKVAFNELLDTKWFPFREPGGTARPRRGLFTQKQEPNRQCMRERFGV